MKGFKKGQRVTVEGKIGTVTKKTYDRTWGTTMYTVIFDGESYGWRYFANDITSS